MIYSVLEQHIDGSMWYHPGWSFNSNESAVNFIQEKKQQDFWSDRDMEIFTHDKPLPQGYSTCTLDRVNFRIVSGFIIWNKDQGAL